MKKLLLIIGCVISILANGQQTQRPYDFPVKPGTDQWAKLNSSEEMDKVCIIPEKVLDTISTIALLYTCLDYPRLIDIYLANDLQKGFEFYSYHFNGLSAVLKRPDLRQALFYLYTNLDIQKKTMEGYYGELSDFKIGFFELIIAQEKVLQGYNDEERDKFLTMAIKNLEKRKESGESIFRQTTSALIISRILRFRKIDLSEKDKNGNDIFELFNNSAKVSDTTVIDKILAACKMINK